MVTLSLHVIPAKAGIPLLLLLPPEGGEIPAISGMTGDEV
jgi:hypothetical protein